MLIWWEPDDLRRDSHHPFPQNKTSHLQRKEMINQVFAPLHRTSVKYSTQTFKCRPHNQDGVENSPKPLQKYFDQGPNMSIILVKWVMKQTTVGY